MMEAWDKVSDLISYHIGTGVYEKNVTPLHFVKSPPYLYFPNLIIMIYYLKAFA